MIVVALLGTALAGALVGAVLTERAAERRRRRVARVAEREVADTLGREHEAQAERERLVAALDVLPVGVVVWDSDGREVYRNRAAVPLASARHAEALIDGAVRDELGRVVRGDTGTTRELDLFGPPRRRLVLVTHPLGTGGAVAVLEDVSEQRRLEEVRRDFVANLSHELKTPIGALSVLADAIASEADMSTARPLAERMTDEAFRVAHIIDDLLDLSRIEAGAAPASAPVPVGLVVGEAVDRVRPLASQRSIVLEVIEVSGPRTVVGDRRQLASAVGNLLENACKYSEVDSTVEVHVRAVDGCVEIEVRDHGIGIPARDIERVFERFYRVDRARSRETGGTGLGLSIVRHVATNHGGDVSVESQEGEGSVFTLRLPEATDDDGTAPPSRVAAPATAGTSR